MGESDKPNCITKIFKLQKSKAKTSRKVDNPVFRHFNLPPVIYNLRHNLSDILSPPLQILRARDKTRSEKEIGFPEMKNIAEALKNAIALKICHFEHFYNNAMNTR